MKSEPKLFTWFLICWAVLNLVQAYFTPIHNDEAYYWMYSRYPAWGYYDHPPMIAMMIGAGYVFFHNTLGVRLFTVITQLLTILIIRELIDTDKKNDKNVIWLFILVIVVLPVLNITGVLATPDSPLLFFTAVFLLLYRRFLQNGSWLNTFLTGASMAAIMYSKYHGALMLLLIILSNLKLLKQTKFYVAVIFAVILYIPHILWQFSNGFPSIKYHLAERASGFDLANVPEYLLNQLGIHNPLLIPLFLVVIFRAKTRDTFERGLKFIIAGFFIFFLAASFRYKVQPQWTSLITIPLIILFFNKCDFSPKVTGYLRTTALVVLPLLLFVRSALMIDFLPVSFLKKEFHGYKTRMIEIEKLAGARPVVFTNSYQDPSVYTFYTGKFAHTLDNKDYRKTQYDIWPFEEMISGKEILYIPHYLDDYYKAPLSVHVTTTGDTIYYRIYRDFQSLQKDCVLYEGNSLKFSKSGENNIDLRIYNPYKHAIRINHPELPVVFQAGFFNSKGYLDIKKNLELPGSLSVINPGDTINVKCRFTLEDLPEGKYRFVIMTETGTLYDTCNSRFCEADVTN